MLSYKFLGYLLYDVCVVDASSVVFECAFDPHARLLVQSQVVIASTETRITSYSHETDIQSRSRENTNNWHGTQTSLSIAFTQLRFEE